MKPHMSDYDSMNVDKGGFGKMMHAHYCPKWVIYNI